MFLEKLDWRYATKKMDPSKPVAEETVAKIVHAVRMAPTSSGVQPFELFVVRNAELREKLKDAAFGQSQLTDGSHLLVFAAWDNYSEERIDSVLQQVQQERGENEGMVAYYQRLKEMYLPRSQQENFEHASRQAYIALGFALAAAAELGVDSTPMEGFDPAKFDDLLGLSARGLKSVVILPLGYRDAGNDWLVSMKKVRKPQETFVTEIA
ncbi:NAD(P)H-dependent oxidoreductase [Pseudooceanicola sediminis]|uniref:NAD(P)H-dependent oxidoreductase n=1 Tax=Pseudooceanicola sediminis TaxID=2211117 RepID=A0A399IZU1_9RHOB|nr:nitroreductase family protein [Pseudooceanicola sediminis]RII37927.1 NAD(P)H-dependent oxidoreductase [Pseudooceanicola sediminis]|tara:strand:+ start:49716 stop:50345 length:630 start_codon:yes stop_codon:yes gene_type:complete